MKRDMISAIESLESRMFLSAAVTALPTATGLATPGLVVSTAPTIFGLNLKATAGTPFSGNVGFYPSPVLDPPLAYGATISWGDGTVSNCTVSYGTNGVSFGYIFHGVHTYAKAGLYGAKVTVFTHPIMPNSTFPTTILEYIYDKVSVAAFPANSSNGVTIDEVAGKAFTGVKLGTFSYIAPATNLSATINWGDGTSSKGVIVSTGVTGIDVIDFKITGGHTYALAGKYAIHIVVSRPSPVTGGAAFVVATIESTAIVIAPVAVG